jgi:prepilin-type processing-associated H-X9-DG protein
MNLIPGSGGSYTDYGNWFVLSLAGVEEGSGNFYPSKCVLNDPSVYLSPGDKYASKILQEYIIMGVDTSEGCNVKSFTPWSRVANADFGILGDSISFFLSYCTIANLDGSVPLATTPLAFTRGLKSDGTWDEKYGLYGSKDGYVVFCDGHVTWFDGSKPAKFLHWNGEKYTIDIRQAVPNVAKIGNGDVFKTPTAQYSNIVIWGSGTGGA